MISPLPVLDPLLYRGDLVGRGSPATTPTLRVLQSRDGLPDRT
jgi:hypothetical protein